MFKIPDWEEDVPNSNTAFSRKSKIKNVMAQKSPTKNKIINVKEKIDKLSKNKLPISNHKQNSKIQKTLKKSFNQKGNLERYKNVVKSEVTGTQGLLRFDQRAKGVEAKSSHLKQHKKFRNKEVMIKRLQNKSVKVNTKKVTYNKHETDKIKTIHKKNNIKLSQKHNIKNETINNKDVELQGSSSVHEIENDKNNTKKNKWKRQITESDSLGIKNFDSDMLDEIVINAKKKRIDESLKNDDDEHKLFNEIDNKPKFNRKKEMLRKMLEVNSRRNHIEVKGNNLRERMLERLKAAQFRYLNEKLYTSSGSDAQQLFQGDPTAFQTYHQGYQQQLKKWPINPLDVIVKKIIKMPKTHIIADMGCGEAALSRRVPQKVRSFDLVASTPEVEACDMAHTPLLAESVDAAVYCLALMGTDLTQYLVEANRVLKMDGHLLIAEVESRFDDVEAFAKEVQRLGFKLKNLDKNNKVFFFMEFTKVRDPPAKKSKLPALTLKPCLYKRR